MRDTSLAFSGRTSLAPKTPLTWSSRLLAEFGDFLASSVDHLMNTFMDFCATLCVGKELKMFYPQEKIGGFNIFFHRALSKDEASHIVGFNLLLQRSTTLVHLFPR